MLTSIPDDGTLDSALYGSAHIETILARENGQKMLAVYEQRIDSAYAALDADLASSICIEAPELIHSDEPLGDGWPDDIRRTVGLLRYITRQQVAAAIVRQWIESADHRGRLIGLGEHSARASVSGRADGDYKLAMLRGSGA